MKNVMLKIGGLVVIGMLCTLVPASLYAVENNPSCGYGSLSVKVTPSTLNLSTNPGQQEKAVIKAHISGGNLGELLAAHNNGNEFRITCINGLPASIAAIPGMASIDDDGEVLSIGFYRRNLIDAINALGGASLGSANITVAQSGTSVNISVKSFTLCSTEPCIPTVIYTGDISGFTTLNLGEASTEDVYVEAVIAGASTTEECGVAYCFLGGSSDLISIPLTGGCSQCILTNATLLVTVYGSGSSVDFTGITLTGSSTTGGVSGSDDIKLK